MLRFYFKIDPDVLTDEQWAEWVNWLWWVLKFTGQFDNKGENKNFNLQF